MKSLDLYVALMKIKKAALKPLKIYVYRKEKTLYRTFKVQIGGLIHMEVHRIFEPLVYKTTAEAFSPAVNYLCAIMLLSVMTVKPVQVKQQA